MILVIGGQSKIGSALINELLARDQQVRALVRSIEKADSSPAGVEAVTGDLADPESAMVVAVLLYAYARGLRSSRKIERGLVEDVAFRVIAANQVPDHTTIARFRQRHEAALA